MFVRVLGLTENPGRGHPGTEGTLGGEMPEVGVIKAAKSPKKRGTSSI